jgi:squalene synthase HpnC
VGHYENFPIASVLCPARLRPPIRAIYRFARTADDLADEGPASAEQRLAKLARYREALIRASAVPRMRPAATPDAWPEVFDPLAEQIWDFKLPPQHLHALLDAFEQDVRNPTYADRDALQDYCRRSANPIGRLLLHLYGIRDAELQARSDDICTALQLINFWQDLSIDVPRGRLYLPEADCARHGVDPIELLVQRDGARVRALVRDLCQWAETLMLRGAPLALRVPGRAGWELRLVVQGGLRILDKLRAIDHASLGARPTLGVRDWPVLVRRAFSMTTQAEATVQGLPS